MKLTEAAYALHDLCSRADVRAAPEVTITCQSREDAARLEMQIKHDLLPEQRMDYVEKAQIIACGITFKVVG
jgi:hypothetical protein